MTASDEGMPGPEEGRGSQDHHQLSEVVRTKGKIGKNSKRKSSQ
jgi:hypothetical protein